ncbi:MAG: hypothetical protein M3169_17605 [Candidatus Eremiobacteraeota bacterium]|nr:hypothetical protein [Candidatus Eremiobacteraeota bacterium]
MLRPCTTSEIIPAASELFTSESPASAGKFPWPPPCPLAPWQAAQFFEYTDGRTVLNTGDPAAATCCSVTPDA